MKPGESYYYLSILLDYPQDKAATLIAANAMAECLTAQRLATDVAPFVEYVKASSLGALQEEYVRTFDFNPLCAPYISHHLYGDNNKKSDFMISLKELYRQYDFTPRSCELPDHVATLFDCAAHLCAGDKGAARSRLISAYVSEGLAKMNSAAAAKDDLWWRYIIAAAVALSEADRQEVHHA